ncbi:hypothetical protein [Sphingomonas xinjiangensis]|uniref:Transmembrane protein n=1 Tax=Sphingomonas xinjiangensis TaxID=643568 RepID=A0A840YPA7_9SPHN|nr:hypothetical protein [Sphingomonas xinjiangensis]MBB5709592.1 hypothetical protein [Sphingomonas xinjiangensis]
MARLQMTTLIRQHWFYLLLPLWFAASVNLHFVHDWARQPRFGEAAALFDWCLFVPALYALCYRGRRPAKAVAVRVVALVCTGVWVAGRTVPDPAELVLRELGWLRGIGVAGLLLLELGAMIAMLRIAFSKKADAQALVDTGLPPLVARLMLAEARFWRWLFRRRPP